MVPNGVEDIEALIETECRQTCGRLAPINRLILSLGRISWKKGLDRLLRAIARTDVGKLAIVGPDDEKLTPQLERLACELKLTDRVRFLPRTVLGADKEYLFRSAKVFVLPSYSENFANSILEAMQRGVPVVLTPEVGAAEIVQECGGGSGCFRRPGAAWDGDLPADRGSELCPGDGRSRAETHTGTLYLESDGCPDGRFVRNGSAWRLADARQYYACSTDF